MAGEDGEIVAVELGDAVSEVFDGSEGRARALLHQSFGCGLLHSAHVAKADAERATIG